MAATKLKRHFIFFASVLIASKESTGSYHLRVVVTKRKPTGGGGGGGNFCLETEVRAAWTGQRLSDQQALECHTGRNLPSTRSWPRELGNEPVRHNAGRRSGPRIAVVLLAPDLVLPCTLPVAATLDVLDLVSIAQIPVGVVPAIEGRSEGDLAARRFLISCSAGETEKRRDESAGDEFELGLAVIAEGESMVEIIVMVGGYPVVGSRSAED